MVIVTDDKSSGKEPVKEAVKPLQDKGVRIYIVNIGSKPDEGETKDIVPDEKNVLTPKTTDEVPPLAPKLAKKITDDTNDRKFKLYMLQVMLLYCFAQMFLVQYTVFVLIVLSE